VMLFFCLFFSLVYNNLLARQPDYLGSM
jgi:hypothetical protein